MSEIKIIFPCSVGLIFTCYTQKTPLVLTFECIFEVAAFPEYELMHLLYMKARRQHYNLNLGTTNRNLEEFYAQ